MKFKLQCASLLLLFCTMATAQQKQCGYQNFWFKADYKNLKHAQKEKDRYTAILKSADNDTVIAKAYNVIGLYHDFSGSSDSALVYFKKALKHLKKYPAKQIAPLINIATEYNIVGNFDTSLQWSNKALKLNNNHGGNEINKVQIYHAIAASYLYKGDIEKATANVLVGIKILERRDDTCYLGQLKVTLAGTYLQSNNYRFAADLLEEYLLQNKKNKDSKVYAIATVNYTENLIELGESKRAFALLEDIIPYVQRSGDKELVAVLYAKMGSIEDLWGNTSKSLVHYAKAYQLLSEKKSKYSMLIFSNYISVLNEAKKYKEAIALINEFRNSAAYLKSHTQERYEYEQSIAESYALTNNWKESTKAYKKAMLLCDTLRMLENGRTTNALQAEFQTEFQREKNMMLASHNESLQKKVATEQRLMMMYILGSLAIMVIILMFLRGYWLKNRLQKEELKSVETKKNYLEQQHTLEQELSNYQKQVIEEKQREATSMALQMANYYDGLNSVLEKLNDTSKLGDVKKELQYLTRQKDYWKEFEIRFKNANPDFESKLIATYPMLTKNDIQFCSLLKLNLSYKEIASLLQISYESAVTKRYRIKKKLGINEDAEFEKLLLEL